MASPTVQSTTKALPPTHPQLPLCVDGVIMHVGGHATEETFSLMFTGLFLPHIKSIPFYLFILSPLFCYVSMLLLSISTPPP